MKVGQWCLNLFIQANDFKIFVTNRNWNLKGIVLKFMYKLDDKMASLAFSSILALVIQGISYWNVKSNLGLTDRNMLARIYLKVVLKSWGLDNLPTYQNYKNLHFRPSKQSFEKMKMVYWEIIFLHTIFYRISGYILGAWLFTSDIF